MEKSVEELILQELREIKGALNSLGERMDALETRMDALETRMGMLETRMDALESRVDRLERRMDTLEEKIEDLIISNAEIRTACNSLLDWADRVHAVEYATNKNYPRVGPVGIASVRENAVGEERARYYVESGGKRTYY